jgi:HD-GYP domain-containing protein (c-di-GMP phosphodiesterase class II)
MPVIVDCANLQPGMRLAEAIITRGRVMFAGGRELSADDIAILQRRFPKLTVRVGDPVLDDLIDFEDDSRDREVALAVQQRIGEAMAGVHEKFGGRAMLSGLNFAVVHQAVQEVIEFLQENPVSAMLLSHSVDEGAYLSEHAGNVFYASMLMGSLVREYIVRERRRLSVARELPHDHVVDITPLGLGAMFADIGMLPLKHLLDLAEPLTEEQRAAVLRHPIEGANALPDEFSPLARMIVRTHHENYNGTGYPAGLAREKLHIFTRIVRIADAFDAATTPQLYRDAKSPARVIWEMTVGPYRGFYDPYLMKMFARMIQPFPIGAKLKLACGRYGVVARYNHKNPFEPYVILAFDHYGHRLPDSELAGPFRLGERYEWRVVSFGDEDLSYIYSTRPQECSMPDEPGTVFEALYP